MPEGCRELWILDRDQDGLVGWSNEDGLSEVARWYLVEGGTGRVRSHAGSLAIQQLGKTRFVRHRELSYENVVVPRA